MLPNKEHKKWHNAFYRDIRSNDINHIEELIKVWPHDLEELDEVLSRAYGELKLKNVLLENKTEIFIENKLINLRFFSNTSSDDQSISNVDLNNTRERIDLTLESIRLLKTDYSKTEEVDGKFIFLAKCIAKNLHILKHQLKSTHDKLPWEQMEFCLVIFISSYTKRQEINLFYRTTLNKSRILNHIENFGNKLEAQKGKLKNSKHEQKVERIIKSYPQFEELYSDNQMIREVQSLLKISEHIKSKVKKISNPKTKDGQLVIAKALQLFGEYLESTLESSKLREQDNTREIIVELRNSLEKIGTEKKKFPNAYTDIIKIGDVITGISNELNTNKAKIFVNENLIISLRSFFITFGKDPSLKGDNDKNALIQLILQSISLLKENYSNAEEVDEQFIFATKSIEQNISKVKRELKLTYDRLHWEEMEFCLATFVNSYTKEQEMNVFYRALLNKSRILSHLEGFAKKIKDGNMESEQVVTNKDCPGFGDLYKDYQKIRDVHSLKKISDHIELALSANPNEKDGQLIITRVVQVIGEHLKNTPESPKLSDAISERLLLSMQNTTRTIIRELRDLLSHDDNDSLSKRIEIEKKLDYNFFSNVKNDLKKVGDVITDILYNNQIETIGILLKQIVDCKNPDEIKKVAEVLTTVQLDELTVSKKFKMVEHEKLEELVNELRDSISDKTDSEKEMFNEMDNELKCAESRSENLRSAYVAGVKSLKKISDSLALIILDEKRVELIKLLAENALTNINSKMEPRRWKKLSDLSMKFYNIVLPATRGNSNYIGKLIFEIFDIAEFGTRKIKWIEKFREKLNKNGSDAKAKGNKQDKIDNVPEKRNNQLALKLSELERILSENLLSSSAPEKLTFYKSDKKSQAVVEMHLLDIMAILDKSKNYLENNLLFLDDNAPLLNGKCLRNHLAHDNALFEVLLSDPSIAVISNAKKLTEEKISEGKKKIGKLVKDDPFKLRKKYKRDLFVITNQERMFVALEEGDIETFKDCLQKGADIKARSINSWTTLHFAAKGLSSNVKYIADLLLLNLGHFRIPGDFNAQSPLHIAAAHGRNVIVDCFIKKYSLNVDILNNRIETPLHLAAQNGHKDTVKVLLECKANTATQDERGRSPVHYAIRNNHTEVAKMLLRKDNNVDNKTIGNYSPLHLAANLGNLKLVKFLLENNAQVNAKTDKDTTPLHLAALSGHQEVVNALIENKADVNATELHNRTPLHYAIENNHEAIAIILLKHTNVNAFDKSSGNSLLDYAISSGSLSIVNRLLQIGNNANCSNIKLQNPLHNAAYYGHSKICDAFLQHGVTIDARDETNNTPLHYAAGRGHKETAEFLIGKGADFDAKNSNDNTPIYLAAVEGHKGVIDLLINKKAKVNEINADGCTTLHAAAANGNKDVLDILIKKGAKCNAAMVNGATPLHITAQLGHTDATDLLLKSKAKVNARANNGLTPLEVAAIGGYKEVVNLLIEKNDQDNEIGTSQSMALYIASQLGHKEIVEISAKKGADVNLVINAGTPLISAIRYNHEEIVKILIEFGANITVDALNEAVCTGHTDIVKILLESHCTIIDMPVDIWNVTPLHLAADGGHKEIVQVLIDKGADRNAITVIGQTPLYLAARKGYEEVVEILIAGEPNDVNLQISIIKVLFEAVAMGQITVVKVLLQNEAVKILLQDKTLAIGRNDNTLLHIASQKSNLQMVEYLVDQGFDIKAKNAFDLQPIHFAARQGHKNTLDFFLKTKELSINEPDGTNMTLLHHAALKDHLEVVNYLIAHGANVNTKTDNGLTALHIAAQFGHGAIIQVLLQNGAMYNAIDKFDKTQLEITTYQEVNKLLTSTDNLFLAVKGNSSSKVENCIKAGAIVNAKDIESVTPLHYAAWKGYEEVVNILLRNMANPNVVGKQGLTALHYAAKFSRLEIVKALLSNYAIYNPLSDGGKKPSDFTKDESITKLFKLVDDSFNSIKEGDPQLVDELNKIKDKDTIKSIMRARNRENKTLVVVAMHTNFSKVEQLKEISQDDVSAQIKTALQLFDEGNCREALCVFKSALKKRNDVLGSDNPGTLDIKTYIAKVLFAQGNYQEALNTYEEILQKQKEILGFGSKDTLPTRSSIAIVLHRLGKNEEAFNIHQEIYQKQKELLEPNHLDTLVTQLHMALVLQMQEKYEEALNIVRTVFGKQNEIILEILRGATLSTAEFSQSNIAILKNYEYYISETEEAILGIDHSDTSKTPFGIAEEHFRLKKYPKALKALEEVLNIQKCVLGPNHPKTLDTQYRIANVLFIQGKWTDAFTAFEEVLDPIKTASGPHHSNVKDILEKLEILNLKFGL